ncbi:CLUMA_CG000235, isoform A [Clunio marinus]|uniref:CLUMA_CG000235, isoform A n=1 Tax=Clunio marinus TaxID=568069 RepID=A0A1J1HIH4_9DIPT|nr:CLUMA_CG000235, isoform A [Clunio marinus]
MRIKRESPCLGLRFMPIKLICVLSVSHRIAVSRCVVVIRYTDIMYRFWMNCNPMKCKQMLNFLQSFMSKNNNNNNASSTSNCGSSTTTTSSSMNKRHCDDSTLAPGSSRIPLTRSCSSPAVSHEIASPADHKEK